MTLSVKRINDTFVGEVQGVNLADDHGAGEIKIRDALMVHGMLVFHGQEMTSEEHVRFSQNSDRLKFTP